MLIDKVFTRQTLLLKGIPSLDRLHQVHQEQRPVRQFPLPRPETDQVRPREQPYFSAETWLDALPEQPSGHGHGKKCYCQPVMWQVVHQHSDRIRSI